MDVSEEADTQRDVLLERLEEKVKRSLCRGGDITVMQKEEKVLAAVCEADLKGAQVIRQRIEGSAFKELKTDSAGGVVFRIATASYPEEAVSDQELLTMAKERLRG